ncbi:MAG: Gmad2 immunoglobulin-like domain-containing protein [Candidatus Berkelbacteria bacterium]|nr:Gmad2 immunoglobulin-like domain-containing protein [Candidatus Berkelbacteria bacterium]
MNKALIWIIIAVGIILIVGNGLCWYFLVYKHQKSESSATSQETSTTSPDTTSTSSTATSDSTKTTSESAKTVKDVHCLQKPTKGTNIVIQNLTEYSTVKSPLSFTGYANAFENTFQYRLKDCRGPILDSGTITASGEVGLNPAYSKTITFTLLRSPMDATLEVYELSMADGSETSLYQVPLRLTK